ncbi:hypothetical protein NPN18_26195, partial [Vibrio parahaemolyticus]|nr:hypothetical protein [Vibrio parahaemolyticus]
AACISSSSIARPLPADWGQHLHLHLKTEEEDTPDGHGSERGRRSGGGGHHSNLMLHHTI